jgi:hypothetical protein
MYYFEPHMNLVHTYFFQEQMMASAFFDNNALVPHPAK